MTVLGIGWELENPILIPKFLDVSVGVVVQWRSDGGTKELMLCLVHGGVFAFTGSLLGRVAGAATGGGHGCVLGCCLDSLLVKQLQCKST